MTEPAETATNFDSLTTVELRDRAFQKAREHHDLRFFWDLVKHLPAARALSDEDGSLGAIAGSLTELVSLGQEFTGRDLGEEEPLLRARFITYLRD